MSTALSFLDAVTGHLENSRTSSADRPIRQAVVDPAYNPFAAYPAGAPAARVTFEGEDALSGKAHPVAQGFIPRGGQRVWMVPVGTTYLISGATGAQALQGFWQDSDGADFGVDFGGGSYWDNTDGLYLETDATVAGDLQAARVVHAARGLQVPEIQMGTALLTVSTATGAYAHTLTWPVAWPAGTVPLVFVNIATTAQAAQLMARAWNASATGCSISIIKADAAAANFTLSNLPVLWVALAQPSSF